MYHSSIAGLPDHKRISLLTKYDTNKFDKFEADKGAVDEMINFIEDLWTDLGKGNAPIESFDRQCKHGNACQNKNSL